MPRKYIRKGGGEKSGDGRQWGETDGGIIGGVAGASERLLALLMRHHSEGYQDDPRARTERLSKLMPVLVALIALGLAAYFNWEALTENNTI